MLRRHGLLEGTPDDCVKSIAHFVLRAWKGKGSPPSALNVIQRKQAISKARTLLRHLHSPPRVAAATGRAREALIKLLDSSNAVVKLAAASGYHVGGALSALKGGDYTDQDLHGLLAALYALQPGQGAARPQADYLPLLRGALDAWEACKRTERYTFDQYTDPPTMVGALPEFLYDLIALSRLKAPSGEALHRHLRILKKF